MDDVGSFERFSGPFADAMFLVSSEGIVLACNAPAGALCGRAPLAVRGRPVGELVAEPHEEVQRYLGLCARSRAMVAGALAFRAGGALLECRVDGALVRPRDGASPALLILHCRRKAEAALGDDARRREELLAREKAVWHQAEAASRLKDEFLATLSHELRTPLGAISGWVHLLGQADLPPDQAAHGLAVIERNVRAQMQLISDLLDVSRIVSGKLSLDIAPVDLGSVVEAALESVRLAAVAKGISARFCLGPGVGLVHGDADRLQQVVWNVLQNAIKFTPGGGRVEIDLRAEGSFVQITVTDSGVGIAPELLPHLFERFRQADSSLSRRHGGLGLGLTLVRQLVELHGGTVRADSPGEGEGTTITIRLPRRAAPVEAAPPPAERDAPRASEPPRSVRRELDGVRILLVDDDGDSRELLRLMLQRFGAEVDDVASANEALERLRLSMPDVLISDISMPGQDGYSLIRRLRALPEAEGGRVPAVALTALARRDDMERALREGFQMHLTKPIRPPALSAAVAQVLGREPPGAA